MGSNTDHGTVAPSGPCLKVPNVQEIVRNDPLKVPERYLRKYQEGKPVNSHEIPIIDFSLLSRGHKEELHKLDLACQQWGFFQIVNHGVETEVLQAMKDAMAKFFELPLEEKNKISMTPDDIQGYGTSNVVSEEEILDWSDKLVLIVHPTRYRKLKLWPTPKGFKEVVEAYSNEVKRVGEEILRTLSLVMGLEKDALLGLHQDMLQGFRVNYYPPCSMPDKVLGLTPHSDPTTLTILAQSENVPGLEIRQGGEWVLVNPIPNYLIVNVGDVIEIWSNGKYKSVEHRAVTSESKTRISYATFFFPQDDVEVEPFDHMVVSPGSLQTYKKVRYGDYRRQPRGEGKVFIQMAKSDS